MGTLNDPHDRRVGLLLFLGRLLSHLILARADVILHFLLLLTEWLIVSASPLALLILADPALLLQPLLLLALLLLPFGLLDLTLGLLSFCYVSRFLLLLSPDLLEA